MLVVKFSIVRIRVWFLLLLLLLWVVAAAVAAAGDDAGDVNHRV